MKGKDKRKRRAVLSTVILLTVMGALSLALYQSYRAPEFMRRDKTSSSTEPGTNTPEEPEATGPSPEEVFAEFADLPQEPFEYPITLMAVGDNLMHMGVVYTGR